MAQEQDKLTKVGETIRQTIEEMPDIGNLKEQIEIEVTPEGLRINLIDASLISDSALFFDRGSARLKPMASLILSAIASELGKLPNNIMVEGHTDTVGFRNRTNYSNWELSADRANSARRLMEKKGLTNGQVIAIRGFAGKNLRIPDNPEDPRNRRVTIIVKNIDPEQYAEQMKVEMPTEEKPSEPNYWQPDF